MKTRLSLCLAVAALFCCSATAYGQYVQQHPGQQWNNPAIRASIQQPVVQQPVMQQPMMQQPVAPVAPVPPVGSGGAYFQQGNCNPGNCNQGNCNSGCGCDGGYGGCDTGYGGGGYGGCDTGCGGGGYGGCDTGCGGGGCGGHIGGGCGGGHLGGGCGKGGCGHLGGGCGIGGGHLGGGCGIGGGGGGHCGGGGGGGGGCGPYHYFSAFGGYSDFDPLAIDVSLDIPNTIEADASLGPVLDNAYTIGGAIGRKKGCFRQEVEFAYRKASVSGLFLDADIPDLPVNLPPLNLDDFDGKLNNYSFLCNLLWDINCGCDCAVYVGGGVGFGFSDLDVTLPQFRTTATVKDSSFVYQGILGISKSVTPKCDLFFEYRYFGTDETSIAVDTPLGGGVATSEITSNNYIGGIRIKKW